MWTNPGRLPLAGLVVIAWAVVLAVLVHGVRTRRRNLAVPVAALAVGVLALLHSLIDFSLQIPGFSILAFALVGTGLAQSFNSSTKRGVTHNSKSSRQKIKRKPEMVVTVSDQA